MKITNKQIKAYIKHQLTTDRSWTLASLIKVLQNQTIDELRTDSTRYNNDIGFTAADAHILTQLAKYYEMQGQLTLKQLEILFDRMPKYWKQVKDVSNPNVLKLQTAFYLQAA